ncbi:hypothetical protein [Mycolicibacterium houstonense]|uniref:hypothetical protein n=1 Tax=Mycolicibacterium houstonense TaxID=146021 RepID=UPI003F9AEC00
MTAQMVQYDLFGEIEAAERSAQRAAHAASAAAITFLTETPWPDLISWWVHPEATQARLEHGDTMAKFRHGPDGTHGWAWAIWRDGLRFEAAETWQGWGHRPRWCIPWSQLHTLRDAHPEVTAQLQALCAGRGHPYSVGWRWWTDPHALHPHGWHPSYLHTEQKPDYYHGCSRPETAYADRIRAWNLTLDAVTASTLTARYSTSPKS